MYETLATAEARLGRRLGRKAGSMGGFGVMLGLSGRESCAAHRIFFPVDYDAEFDAIFCRLPAPVAYPMVYVLAPDDLALRSNFFFFSSRRRHTRFDCDWSSDVCSSD